MQPHLKAVLASAILAGLTAAAPSFAETFDGYNSPPWSNHYYDNQRGGAQPAAAPVAALAYTSASSVTFKQPDLLSIGVGYEDFDKDEPRTRAANFRGEYRWGVSLLPTLFSESWFRSWDDYVQVHPFAGVETTTLGALWAGGGFNTDFLIGRHGVVTWQEAVGFYYGGNAKPLGSNVEFRSQIEAGWIFNDQTRLTAQASHESNAGLTQRNPGEETIGLYYHVPIDILTGKASFHPFD